ncbi:patatin-like phospholipase family protein [Bradyrhizobium sp. 190]|uniref:patatin-like phospholipase family protein n=1 Tax=Bradyrhizobium sp. 190 TaxID=2782658 RepID=UPI001FFA7FA7|nr:patatin-like phospholipase family protein [Bradyrhizobium sp. 190]MCK1517952.1 patatin-like phospholipase family protein [Bradyrhizobium sp. 190]
MVKRAIALGGGGPAAGLHIGVLEAIAAADIEPKITFDVWALSCIGAWVGIVYNQFGDEVENKDRAELTYQFFKNDVFRDDESYERFPINTVFGPDWRANIKALNKFVTDSDNYKDFVWDPYRMVDSFQESISLLFNRIRDGEKLDDGDINGWIFNHGMAPNPLVRYLTSMMYLSNVTGLSRINYPNSEFMKRIRFENLFDIEKREMEQKEEEEKKEVKGEKEEKEAKGEKEEEKKKPFIFHNAWNLDKQELALFSNRPMRGEFYQGPINASTLCACSALPFIEETVKIDGDTYCEGALVDTVNFWSLIEEHHKPDDKLDEIWVVRIVDSTQVRKPDNLHDALANLCQLFAATVGEDDVKLFKYHVQHDKLEPGKEPWGGTVVEIHVPSGINFKWNHSNLDMGRKLGREAAVKAIAAYEARDKKRFAKDERVRFINERKDDKRGRDIDRDRLARALATATGTPDLDRWLKKMKSQVDLKSGREVVPDGAGKYPKDSIPYPDFALRNPEVKANYDRLGRLDPGLERLF